MPFENGTGPRGAGPMTGRGLGACGNGQGRFVSRGFGRGGRSMRFGNSKSNVDGASTTQEQIQDLTLKIQTLSEQIEQLKNQG